MYLERGLQRRALLLTKVEMVDGHHHVAQSRLPCGRDKSTGPGPLDPLEAAFCPPSGRLTARAAAVTWRVRPQLMQTQHHWIAAGPPNLSSLYYGEPQLGELPRCYFPDTHASQMQLMNTSRVCKYPFLRGIPALPHACRVRHFSLPFETVQLQPTSSPSTYEPLSFGIDKGSLRFSWPGSQ